MSSLTSGPNLSAAFIDLATYGELEKRLYGDYPKSSDNPGPGPGNFLTYETSKIERFNPGPGPSSLKNTLNNFNQKINFKTIVIILILFLLFKYF
jgi:hypothetical protein